MDQNPPDTHTSSPSAGSRATLLSFSLFFAGSLLCTFGIFLAIAGVRSPQAIVYRLGYLAIIVGAISGLVATFTASPRLYAVVACTLNILAAVAFSFYFYS